MFCSFVGRRRSEMQDRSRSPARSGRGERGEERMNRLESVLARFSATIESPDGRKASPSMPVALGALSTPSSVSPPRHGLFSGKKIG